MNLERKGMSAYLLRKKLIKRGTPLNIRPIGDGQKNRVFQVSALEEEWIINQALSRVQQVKTRWLVDRKRIFAETDCIEILNEIVPPSVIPQVVLEDRTDFIIVTTPPPKIHQRFVV